jgi:ferredoxin-NADP reductase
MERELEVGKDVWLKGPYGEFIISHYLRENDTAVLIAGGTGISPFIPFLIEQKSQFRVELFYGVRSPDVLIFDQELSEVSTRTKERIHLFLEELDESRNADLGKRFEIHRGQLCISDILEITEQKANRVFFLSGPPSMIDTFKKELQNHDILENNIIIDEWG